jgi:arginyl-tRNA synthetase
VSEVIRSELARVASALGAGDAPFVLERPRETGHGDLATNLAMRVARARKVNPRTVAEEILDMLRLPEGVVSRVEIAGPGFINFWLAQDTLAEALQRIVTAGERYGRSEART